MVVVDRKVVVVVAPAPPVKVMRAVVLYMQLVGEVVALAQP